MPRKKPTKRADEEACKQAFQGFLASRAPEMPAAWEDGMERPDYFLMLDKAKFGVEVTTLREMRQLGDKRYPMLALRASLTDLVKEVERAAMASGALHGSYVVSVSTPIKDFRNVRDDLWNDMLQYIIETEDSSVAERRTIYQAGHARLSIEKYGGHEGKIGLIGPLNSRWEIDAQSEACKLLNEILATKRRKLSRVPLPCILLIRDAYHFADAGMMRACIAKLDLLDALHSVIVVSDGSCIVLSTNEPTWK